MRERDIEKYFAKKVKEAGGKSYKFTSPGHAGVPDRIVLLPGRILFAEIKTEGGKLSPLQTIVHAEMRALGASVFVIWSKADVDVFIEGVQNDLV